MPRRLLRNGEIVDDEWQYEAEASGRLAPLIVGFEHWQSDRDTLIARGGRLGVVLAPAHKVELLAPDLAHLALIAAEFSGPAEGRGYTQARLLRERYHFTGELRAIGFVHRDQLFFLARCGFNSFELPESDIENSRSALSTFSAAYQLANDTGLRLKLQRH
jgi:uncharacterized protein (DUF934 family)